MAASTLKAKTAQGYGTGLTAKAYDLTSPYALATNGTSSASTAIPGQPGNYLFTFTGLATNVYDLRIVTASDIDVATGMFNHTDAVGVETPYIDLTGTTVKAVTDAVGSVTGNVGGNVVGSVASIGAAGITAASIATGAIDADSLAADAVAKIWTTAITEAYRTIGATGTGAQLMYEIMRNITAFTIAATTKTVKKLDGTTAKTYTLDDATNPTSITEAS